MKPEEAFNQFYVWGDSGWSKSETPNSDALILAIQALEKQIKKKEKPICDLCQHEETQEYRCHTHLSDDARIEYIKGNIFVLVTDHGALIFNADKCPKCKRDLEGVNE